MRAVLYSDWDMEPITVLEVPQWAREMLRAREPIYFVPPPVINFTQVHGNDAVIEFKNVAVWPEFFVRRGVQHMMLFTADEEVALLLRSEFLPGQQKEVAEKYREGIEEGFKRALDLMRRLG